MIVAAMVGIAVFVLLGPVGRKIPASFVNFPDPQGARSDPFGRRLYGLLRERFRRHSHAEKLRGLGIELVRGFSAELHAGQPTAVALERAANAIPEPICATALGAARLGGNVPKALRGDAQTSGLPILRALAALWQVSEGSGAGLAVASQRLAISQANNEAVRRELAAQLAGPRATARVLAALPAFGLLLGSGLGASPVDWLLGSIWGLMVLTVGCAFEVVGIWWTHRLTRSVELLL